MPPRSGSARHAAPGTARVLFRGTGRPSRLTLTATAALAAAAAATAGIVTGLAPASGAIGGPLRPTGDVAASRAAGHIGRGYRAPSSAGSTIGLPASAGANPAVTARRHRREHGAARRSGAKASPASVPSGSGPGARQASPSSLPSRQPAQNLSYQIYDSITPAAIPAGAVIATYADGKYAVPASAVAGRRTIWIDPHATDPAASVLDVEPGDATPSMVPAWVTARLTMDRARNAKARIYTMLSEWPAVRQAVSTLPTWMQARIRWWIADPTGVPHMVPGASATQWYWGQSYDISTASPGF